MSASDRTIHIDQLHDRDAIAERIAAVGQDIRRANGDGEVFLLGILKGTTCFAADLLRAIPGDVTYGFIDVVRDVSDTDVAAALEIDFLRFIDIAGRNVILLKDVVASGVIENYLLAQLRQNLPRSLALAALIDCPDLRKTDLRTDYRLFECGSGSFVGYGLEYEGRFGNLPFIGRI